MPGPPPQGADLLGFLEQALRRADQPEPAPILDPEENKYHAHWQRGVPLYHKGWVTVHAHPDLGVDGRLGAYECVGPGWQLNVLLTHVPFGVETTDFLDTLSLAYRRLSLLAPTIIIGDLIATEVHILKHRDTWWTVEWDDHGKVRRATAHAPTTKSRPHHAEGTACDSRTHPPGPRGSLRSAALRPLLGAGGARRTPPPGTHPSVDTPRHPLHGPHAPPRGRHRAPAPHLANRPA